MPVAPPPGFSGEQASLRAASRIAYHCLFLVSKKRQYY